MDFSILNKEQQEVVKYNDGPLLVLAGAGSGKTRVLTYKIAYMMEQGINPYNILAITFTNKAANEMKERVNQLLNVSSNKIFVSTFHKFCGFILRYYINLVGYNNNFTIYDVEDQKKLMNKVLSDMNVNNKMFSAKSILSKISRLKNSNLTFEDYLLEKDYNSKKIYDIMVTYQDRLKKSNALDYDDMLYLTVKILKNNEDALNTLNDRFKYIFVDEYQDTNVIQYELIKLLTKKTDKLTVVGDEDQSIYKFRGADIRNIQSFEADFKNAKIIKLTQNYRSTNNILNVANSVIKNNNRKVEKNLWSDNGDGEIVKYNEYDSDLNEANNVIKDIKRNLNYKNTAILYRNNSLSRKLEENCVSFSIPYTLIGGVNFYDRREVKDIISYLKFLINFNDVAAFQRIINVPKRGIGDTTQEKIINYSYENNISILEALKKSNEYGIKGKIQDGINNFIDIIENINDLAMIEDKIDYILKNGYNDFLISEYGNEDANERIENINEVKNKAVIFKENYINSQDFDINFLSENIEIKNSILEDFLYDVSLLSDLDDKNISEDKLTLMTIHSSKGLEFDNVYIVGLNENIFPSYQAIETMDESDIEEERRLFYVGVTRAKKNLILSSSKTRMINGQYKNFNVSRFITEIDEGLIKTNSFNQGLGFDYNRRFDRLSYRVKKINNDDTVTHRINRFKDNVEIEKTKNLYKKGADIQKIINLDYNVGDRVNHIKFGDGTVKNIDDIGRDYEVTIEFDDIGEKILFAAFAKLKKI